MSIQYLSLQECLIYVAPMIVYDYLILHHDLKLLQVVSNMEKIMVDECKNIVEKICWHQLNMIITLQN